MAEHKPAFDAIPLYTYYLFCVCNRGFTNLLVAALQGQQKPKRLPDLGHALNNPEDNEFNHPDGDFLVSRVFGRQVLLVLREESARELRRIIEDRQHAQDLEPPLYQFMLKIEDFLHQLRQFKERRSQFVPNGDS